MDSGLQRPIQDRLRAYADPAAEAMSDGTRLSVLVVLAHEAADALDRAGRLIDPTTLTDAVASARAEGWREREALKLAMQFLDRCVGEGLGFVADDIYPAADAMDVACAVAEKLEIDVDSEDYLALVAYPAPPTTPGGRTDG